MGDDRLVEQLRERIAKLEAEAVALHAELTESVRQFVVIQKVLVDARTQLDAAAAEWQKMLLAMKENRS
jgi:hypothetical protein